MLATAVPIPLSLPCLCGERSRDCWLIVACDVLGRERELEDKVPSLWKITVHFPVYPLEKGMGETFTTQAWARTA